MKIYIISKSEFKIVAVAEGVTACEKVVSQFSEDHFFHLEALPLPEEFYSSECPPYIKVTSVSTFNVLCGRYPDRKIIHFTASSSAEGVLLEARCFYTPHTAVTSPKVEGLSTEDLPFIGIQYCIKDERFYGDFSLNFSTLYSSQERQVPFIGGVASIQISVDEFRKSLSLTSKERPFCFFLRDSNGSFIASNLYFQDPSFGNSITAFIGVIRERNRLLQICDPLVIRQLTQQQAGSETSMSPQDFQSLLTYMQSLRDLPVNLDPLNPVWPVKPSFLP